MNSHSIIAPSSAHIWGAPDGCTGFVSMAQQFPETGETIEAAEGTASHEIGSILIMDAARGISNTLKRFDGLTASNGVIFTEEMFEAAEIYADNVIEVMRSTGVFGGPNFGNEHRLTMPKIHEQSFGTTDQFIFDNNTGHLYVWDYKFGFEIVEAFENWQSINYIEGILEMLDIDDQFITVHIRIAQPRAHHRDGPIREWVVKASDLRAHFNILNTNAHLSLSDNAECRSGPHCRHCPARHACEAALTAGMRLYEVTAKPVPVKLSNAAIGFQLAIIKRAKKQLEYLETGFEEQVKNVIRSGANIPGWMVEQGVGREKWNKPITEVLAMGKWMKHDLKKPDDAITPVQARKLGIDDAVISAYSIKPSTGLKIVPDNGNKAKQVFNHG